MLMQKSQKLRGIARTGIVVALLIAPGHWMFAQGQSQPQPPVKKSQSGGESCDGALDIVPVKSKTFTRKRRPGKTGPAAADAKDDAKPESKGEAKPDKQ
jgi:hypothetical protein